MKVKDLLKDVLDKYISADNKEEMLCYLKIEQDLIKDYNDFIIGWYKYKNNICILCDDEEGRDLKIDDSRSLDCIKSYDDITNIWWEKRTSPDTYKRIYDYVLPSKLTEKIITILPKELKIDVKKAVDDYIKKTYEGMSYDDYIKSKKDKIKQSMAFMYDLLNYYNYRRKEDLSLTYYSDICYNDADVADVLKEEHSIRFTYKNRAYYLNIYKDYNGVIDDNLFLFSITIGIDANKDKITIETALKEQTVDGLIKTINGLLTKEQAIIKCLSKDFL